MTTAWSEVLANYLATASVEELLAYAALREAIIRKEEFNV